MTDKTQAAPGAGELLMEPSAAQPQPGAPEPAPWWVPLAPSTASPDDRGLSDNDWLANKKFSSFGDMVRSVRALEAKLGEGRAVLPKGPDDREAWDRLAGALGRPDKPEGYELQLAEGYDEAFVGQFRQQAHQLGLAPHQAQALAEWFETSTTQAAELNADATRKALEGQWKGDYGRNMELARRAMGRLELTPDDLNGMAVGLGLDRVMKLMARIGQGSAEDNGLPVSSGAPGGRASIEARMAEIRRDPDSAKKVIDGSDATLRREWDTLNARLAELDVAEGRRG